MREIDVKQHRALSYLSGKLQMHGVPFVIIGGLAAIAWGAKRQLADIDILVNSKDFIRVSDLFYHELRVRPRHYTKNNWDIQQFILEINETTVDVCDGDRLFFYKDNIKHKLRNNINNPVIREICGLNVPVVPLAELVRYKRLIARPVDLEDLSYIEKQLK